MPPQSVIIHERLAHWSRQLRPRFQGWPIRWFETRSGSSLRDAVRLSSHPILLFVIDERLSQGLKELDSALQGGQSAFCLVIDLLKRFEVVEIGRELGVTAVLSGVVVPPDVESLLRRWLSLASFRAEREGWFPSIEAEPEPWDRPEMLVSHAIPHLD